MADILKEILAHKKEEIKTRKALKSENELFLEIQKQENVSRGFAISLQEKISKKQTAIIAEVKKASPSKGVIRENFDPIAIASSFQKAGAACLSVLTDHKYFQGDLRYLQQVRKSINLPILQKDFVIDPYQILEAKLAGADCILLIIAGLDPIIAKDLEQIAFALGLDVLIETHDQKEVEIALNMESKLIGVNNRNLKTLEVDLNNIIELNNNLPEDVILICESGVKNRDDINKIQEEGIYGFLIGESLMKQEDIETALKNLIS